MYKRQDLSLTSISSGKCVLKKLSNSFVFFTSYRKPLPDFVFSRIKEETKPLKWCELKTVLGIAFSVRKETSFNFLYVLKSVWFTILSGYDKLHFRYFHSKQFFLCFFLSSSIYPVSYTHLDVYKRQEKIITSIHKKDFTLFPKEDDTNELKTEAVKLYYQAKNAVSYTHLDVYKRQFHL